MTMLLMFALALLGFCGLSLSLSRHHADALGDYPAPVVERRWRWAGGLLVALSLAIPLLRADYGVAFVEWFGFATVAALIVVGLLTWRPKRLPWLAVPASVAVMAGLIGLAL